MILNGTAQFISLVSGEKNGKSWHRVKFLDEDADEFINAFVNDEIAAGLQGLSRKTPVELTFDMIPGNKYFNITDVGIIGN